MTRVSFSIDAAGRTRPGVALLSVWPAFAKQGFTKVRFDLPYGTSQFRPDQELASGDYWVKVKMPDGSLIQDLVHIPESSETHYVLLRAEEEAQPRSFDLGAPVSIVDAAPDLFLTDLVMPKVVMPDGAELIRNVERQLERARQTTPTDLDFDLGGLEYSGSPHSIGSSTSTPSEAPRSGGRVVIHQDAAAHETKAAPRPTPSIPRPVPSPMSIPPVRFDPSEIVVADGYPVVLLEAGFDREDQRNGWEIRPYLGGLKDRKGRVLSSTNIPVDVSRSVISEASLSPFLFAEAVEPGAASRRFAVIDGMPNGGQTIITVPSGQGSRLANLIIERPLLGDNIPQVTVEVESPLHNSLLQFLRNSDIRAAVQMVTSAVDLMYAKFDDPMAAAAASYVLLNAPPDSLTVPWQEWVGNLGHYFAHVPDGRIVHATLLLQRSDTYANSFAGSATAKNYFPEDVQERLQMAAGLIHDALSKGPPIYRMGLGLLASNIEILLGADLPIAVAESMKKADKLVTALRRRVDRVEPFSVFHLEKEDVQ